MRCEFPIFLLFVVPFVGVLLWLTFARSNSILHTWARRHGYRILNQEYCWFFRGPFFWRSSKNQTVYYVTVLDDEGRRRTGYVRCGGWFLGILSDEVEVVWDQQYYGAY